MSAMVLHPSSIFRGCSSVSCLQFSSIIVNLRSTICKSTLASSPLLNFKDVPDFRLVTANEVNAVIPDLANATEDGFAQFEQNLLRKFNANESVTWDGVVSEQERISDSFSRAWGAVSHLHNVKDTDQLRDAYQKNQPRVVAMGIRLSQSKPVYQAYQALEKDTNLDEAQRRIVQSAVRDAFLSGVHLEGSKKEEFNKIVQELAELGTKYMNNVLDSTKQFSLMLDKKEDIAGLPDSYLALVASAAAKDLNKTVSAASGPWKISLDAPSLEPFLKHSKRDDLREKLLRASVTRAASGSFDNSPIIERILELRRKKATILGFPTFAHLSVDRKMAKTPEAVWKMLTDLKDKCKPIAEVELRELKNFSAANGLTRELMNWDVAFWAERQREQLFQLKEEELKPYFPFPRVLQGLFKRVAHLFQVNITEAPRDSFTAWDKEVRYFHVSSMSGSHIASFFLDAYSRPSEKRAGAWFESAVGKSDVFNRTPIAYLVCNQSPPVNDTPTLMTFREVETLFHEFGHGLQHMLTEVKYAEAAGVSNIEWDAVELPSQFMENWLYDWPTVQMVSGHFRTGEPLPRSIYDQVTKGRTFRAASQMLRQLYYSALDMELHRSNETWREVLRRVSAEYTVMPPLPEDCFPCSFMHIFGGGYAAGYYSYKWAEVMAADAFAAFEEVGLENQEKLAEVGMRFRRTILAMGGSKNPINVFRDFRGRDPDVKSLLRMYGLN